MNKDRIIEHIKAIAEESGLEVEVKPEGPKYYKHKFNDGDTYYRLVVGDVVRGEVRIWEDGDVYVVSSHIHGHTQDTDIIEITESEYTEAYNKAMAKIQEIYQ